MSKSKSGNFEASIHNEAYYGEFDRRNLNHATMIFSDNRRSESLDGKWHFAPDQYDVGLRDNWHVIRELSDKGEQLPWDYHPEEGERVQVPGNWNLIKPQYFYFEGCGWYSRTFVYKKIEADERVYLRVGAANYDGKVYINGTFVGNHVGGSTPFYAELTGYLKPDKKNLIQICVNNTRTADRVPMRNTDWFNWGGLYREVELFRVPQAFIKEFRVWLEPDGTFSRISFSCRIANDAAAGKAVFEIPELGVKKEFPVAQGAGGGTIDAQPALWSPENPKLYDVRLSFEADRVEDRVGFRQIRVKGWDIVLNGKPIFLKGICSHEDDALLGKATNRQDIERRFAHARELGCNFMRLAHYPHHELAGKIADEIGILLWEEIPVYWAIAFDNPATYADAENQLAEMIFRDFNRASVVIWAVGNENADTDERLSFMSRLAKKAKALDKTRMVTAACLVNHAKNIIEDRLIESLDIIGLNEYYGWYKPNFSELLSLGENSKPEKPVIISEFGADARAGHHGTIHEKFTEEYMAHIYRLQAETIRKMAYVKGITPWILYDFTCPRRQNRLQEGYNRKGLIAEDKKTKKKAFFVLQEFYASLQ